MKRLPKIFKRETKKIFQIFSNPTFIYLTVVGNLVLTITAITVYYLEKDAPNAQIKTLFDAFWWAIFTVTTIGYGDVLPQTFAGRIVAIGLMYTGTVIFVTFTGVLLMSLLQEEVEEEMAPLKKEIHQEELSQEKIETMLKIILDRLDQIEKKK